MEIREFRLINDIDNIYDLMDINHYINNPEGLGNTPVQKYEVYNGYVHLTQDAKGPMNVTGTMIFSTRVNPYDSFDELRNYVANSRKIYLEYKTPGSDWVRAEVSKNYAIEKSEIKGTNMSCPITFLRLENWKSPEMTIIPIQIAGTTGKKYKYGYKYAYAGNISNQQEIKNNSGMAIPIRITFEPPYVNPRVEIVDIATGLQVLKWQWLGTINDGEILVTNGIGDHTKQFTYFYNNLGYTNVYQAVNGDPGFSPYIYIPPGSYILKINSDSAQLGQATIALHREWDIK